ncbi:hypothetical protein WME98_25635 [Sorangium sp. So ce296]|uniref:hypothetical protein n=1 Tax=Sorangium sp. So ce296 TaxID=3133296 RepID=UPI003F631DB1
MTKPQGSRHDIDPNPSYSNIYVVDNQVTIQMLLPKWVSLQCAHYEDQSLGIQVQNTSTTCTIRYGSSFTVTLGKVPSPNPFDDAAVGYWLDNGPPDPSKASCKFTITDDLYQGEIASLSNSKLVAAGGINGFRFSALDTPTPYPPPVLPICMSEVLITYSYSASSNTVPTITVNQD